jgi:hypothetical protein
MLTPSTPQILKTIANACQTILLPAVGRDKTARSTLQTIKHLLRYVSLRIEQEGRVLAEDVNELATLLAKISIYLDSGSDPLARTESHRIAKLLSSAPQGEIAYGNVSSMTERRAAMNAALDSSLRYLQSIRKVARGAPHYDDIRLAIRRYLKWQIEHEAQLVHPAFEGFGPRR